MGGNNPTVSLSSIYVYCMNVIDEGGRRPFRQRDSINRLKREMSTLQRRFGIKQIGLFGSYARDEAGVINEVIWI